MVYLNNHSKFKHIKDNKQKILIAFFKNLSYFNKFFIDLSYKDKANNDVFAKANLFKRQ